MHHELLPAAVWQQADAPAAAARSSATFHSSGGPQVRLSPTPPPLRSALPGPQRLPCITARRHSALAPRIDTLVAAGWCRRGTRLAAPARGSGLAARAEAGAGNYVEEQSFRIERVRTDSRILRNSRVRQLRNEGLCRKPTHRAAAPTSP